MTEIEDPSLIEQAITNARNGQPWVEVIDVPDRSTCVRERCIARDVLLADLAAGIDLPPGLVARYNALNDMIHHGDAHNGRTS